MHLRIWRSPKQPGTLSVSCQNQLQTPRSEHDGAIAVQLRHFSSTTRRASVAPYTLDQERTGRTCQYVQGIRCTIRAFSAPNTMHQQTVHPPHHTAIKHLSGGSPNAVHIKHQHSAQSQHSQAYPPWRGDSPRQSHTSWVKRLSAFNIRH